jgi:hypothetical protein
MNRSKAFVSKFLTVLFAAASLALAGCVSSGANMACDKGTLGEKTPMAGTMHPMMAMDPMKSERASIDRFSAAAGHLQFRDSMNRLPGPNQPVDFDVPPFVTTGLGPHREVVIYYNLDVQSTTPAPIYVLYRTGEATLVDGQLNIVDVVPGDPGYNDFWQISKVTVPADYLANTVGSPSVFVCSTL